VVVHAIRMAWRGLRRAPGVSALVVAMLAIGIGSTTAIFSFVSALLVRPVGGVADPARIVSLERSGGNGVIDIFSFPDYLDLRGHVSAAMDLAAFRRAGIDVRATDSDRVRSVLVSANYFQVLGVDTRLGRTLSAKDENGSVAVISDACWRRLYASDPDVIGRPLHINGQAFTVVGVLAPSFTGTYPGQPDAVWLPISAQPVVLPRMSAGVLANRNSRWVQIIGRLRSGVSSSVAEARAEAAGEAIAQAFPGDHAAGRVTVRGGLGLASDDRVQIAQLLSLVGGAAALLFLIACGNAVNLLTARAHDRRHELTIRRALGASTTRLGAELLTEGAMLAVTAGAIGLWFAPRAVAWLTAVTQSGYGFRSDALALDWRAALFTAAACALVTVVFTLLPLHAVAFATRAEDALRAGGRAVSQGGARVRGSLVALQAAFSIVLAVGAGLGLRTMTRIAHVQPGYATDGAVIGSFALDVHGYTAPRAAGFFEQTAADLRRQPGLNAVSWSTAIPPVLYGGRMSVFRLGEAPSQSELQKHEDEFGIRSDVAVVGPQFFEALRIELRSGRGFEDRDRTGSQPVAIVNRTLAERLWPGQDPLGRFLEAPPYSGAVPPPMQVIGVAADTRHRSLLSSTPVPVLYLPFLQNPDTRATLIVRTFVSADTVSAAIRRAAASADPDVPPLAIQEIADYDAATLWPQRSIAGAFGFFALCGLLLAAIGIYAMLAHDVASRRRELAIRVALGASGRRLSTFVVGSAMRFALVGTAAGLALSFGAGSRLSGVLFGVSAHDPITFAGAALGLVAIAGAASAVPARRAARADPNDALRLE
jgi:putative ABC transport system permease protein